MPAHPLHEAIGRLLDGVHQILPPGVRAACDFIKDPACESRPSTHYTRTPQNIPLFCTPVRSNGTEFCNVDALLLLGGRMQVIVEVEESALDPTQVFGKFLTSATARCYIHDADGGTPILKGDDVLFVQVMKTSKLKPRSAKPDQWKHIETAVRALLPLGSIRQYHLIHGGVDDFAPGQPAAVQFVACVTAAMVMGGLAVVGAPELAEL